MRTKHFTIASGFVACLLTLGVQQVSATPVTYDLNAGGSGLSGYAGPYGQVQVTWIDATHATITFTSDTVGGNIYLFGGANAVDVNVNATSWTLGTVTGSNAGSGFSSPSYTDTGSKNVGGAGVFNQTIKNVDGFTHSADSVSFELTNTGGSWAAAGDVLTPNAEGNSVAAHIFVTSSPADASNGARTTGFAGNNYVPDGGSSVMLLGSALFGLGFLGYRTRRTTN